MDKIGLSESSGIRKRLSFDGGCNQEGKKEERSSNGSPTHVLDQPQSLEKLRTERLRAAEKWNFDFENEVPLEGDWIWEKVEELAPNNNPSKIPEETDNGKIRNV